MHVLYLNFCKEFKKFVNIDLIRTSLVSNSGEHQTFSHLHDPLGHREVHGEGVRQVQNGNIYV